MLPFDMDIISTIEKWKVTRFFLREGSNYTDFCGAKTGFKRTILLNLAPKFAVSGSSLDSEASSPYDG